LPAFFPEIRAFGGEIVPLQKKFPQHFPQKLLILLNLPRQAIAAAPLNTSLRHVCAVYVPFRRSPAPAASGSLPDTARVRQRDRNFQQG
jgi:hypothetical protein